MAKRSFNKRVTSDNKSVANTKPNARNVLNERTRAIRAKWFMKQLLLYVVPVGNFGWRVRQSNGLDMPLEYCVKHQEFFGDPFEAIIHAGEWMEKNPGKR